MPTPADIFDYSLPEELIAMRPAARRDECRLMVLDRSKKSIKDMLFKDLTDVLGDGDFLVVNNTRVRNARLYAVKPTGARSELFITEILPDGKCKALVRGRFKPGTELIVSGCRVVLLEKDPDGVWLLDACGTDMESLMEKAGHVPLPPYIARKDEISDREDYQTVYSKYTGSAAAPTAGLHFTNELLMTLKKNGVEVIEITLDVGLGTFRPIKMATLEEHIMHKEKYRISEDAAEKINSLKKAGERLIAVGSTAVRALESAACEKGRIRAGEETTNIFITPGYNFLMTDMMITNFHLPKSTLIAMVAAFGGHSFIMNAYKYAIENKYRFFSYGDAMLIR